MMSNVDFQRLMAVLQMNKWLDPSNDWYVKFLIDPPSYSSMIGFSIESLDDYEASLITNLSDLLDRESSVTPEIINMLDLGIQNCWFTNHHNKTNKPDTKFISVFIDHFQAAYYSFRDLV
jgi:predicted AlkP superfamily pyrophosphatase or phosphodiesterase